MWVTGSGCTTSFAQYASAASASSGDAPAVKQLLPRRLRRDLLDAERSVDDLADDVHHLSLGQPLRPGEDVRRVDMAVVDERPHRDGGDVPRVDGGATGRRVRQADDVAGADLGRPRERVGREPPGPQERPPETGRPDQAFDIGVDHRHRVGLLLQVVVHGQRGDVDDALRAACDRLDGSGRVLGARLMPEQEHCVDVVQGHLERRRLRQVAAGDLDAVGPPRRRGSRVSARTSAPSASRPDTTRRPTFPLAPVTRITDRPRGRTRRPPSSTPPSATRPARARASPSGRSPRA